jgi:hypothetical protein
MLFVNGQDRRRWFMKYCVDDYRKALDTVLDSSDPSLLAGGDGSSAEPVTVAEATLPDCCTTGGACRVKL